MVTRLAITSRRQSGHSISGANGPGPADEAYVSSPIAAKNGETAGFPTYVRFEAPMSYW